MGKNKLILLTGTLGLLILIIPLFFYYRNKSKQEPQNKNETAQEQKITSSTNPLDNNLKSLDQEYFNKMFDYMNKGTRYRGDFVGTSGKKIIIKVEGGDAKEYIADNDLSLVCMPKGGVSDGNGNKLVPWEIYTDFTNKVMLNEVLQLSYNLTLNQKLDILNLYNQNEKIIYSTDNGNLVWATIFLDDCGKLSNNYFK